MTNYSFQAVGPIFIITGAITYNIPNVGFTTLDMDILTNDQLSLIKKGLQYNYLVSPNSVNVLAYIESNTVEQGTSSSEQIADSIGSIIAGQNGAQVTYDDNGNQIIIEVPALANKADTVHTHTIVDVTNLQTSLNNKEATIIATTSADYYRGDKTFATLNKAAVGLGNVINVDTTTTTNIADSVNKRFVTDAASTIIGNISGTNTGDETTATIKTKLGIASGTVDGYLTATDWTTFNGKQALITAGTTAQYYRGDKTFQTLDKTAVGLGNVANVDTTNASNISSGTLANARLTTNLSQIGAETFVDGEVIQNFGGTLQNASLGAGTTGAVQITNSAGSILFDAPYAKGPLNQKSGFFEDFITYSGTTISQILLRTVSGAGATTNIASALSSGDTRNGVIVFSTGIAAGGAAGAASGNLSCINFANIPVGGYEEFGARFRIPLLSDATQSFQVDLGFGDSAYGGIPTDGVYVSIGPGTAGMQNNNRSNSTGSSNGGASIVAATDYVVRIRVSNIAGTLSSSFFLNGVSTGSPITASMPSGAGRDLGIMVGLAKFLGTTARTLEVDWVYHESFKPRTINY